jgi:DNA repair exonuclease SbcCD nuclease subunit
MKLPFLACMADNHLGHALRNNDPLFAGLAEHAFLSNCEQLVERAQGVSGRSVLLLAGDISEFPHVGGRALVALRKGLDMLAAANVSVYYIEGNHDRQRPGSPPLLKSFPTIQLLESVTEHRWENTLLRPLRLCGFGSQPGELLKEKLHELENKFSQSPVDIVLLHQPFKHLLGFADAYDMELEDLPAGPCYVVGDIHTTDIRQISGGGLFISPGATVPRTIAESNQGRGHGYVLLNTEAYLVDKPQPRSAVFYAGSDVLLKRFETWEGAFDVEQVRTGMPADCTYKVAVLVHDALGESMANDAAKQLREDGYLVICADKKHPKLLDRSAETEADLPVQVEATEALTFSLMAKLPLVINPERDPLAYEILATILPDNGVGVSLLQELIQDYLSGKRPLPVPKDQREISLAEVAASPEPSVIRSVTEDGVSYAL